MLWNLLGASERTQEQQISTNIIFGFSIQLSAKHNMKDGNEGNEVNEDKRSNRRNREEKEWKMVSRDFSEFPFLMF